MVHHPPTSGATGTTARVHATCLERTNVFGLIRLHLGDSTPGIDRLRRTEIGEARVSSNAPPEHLRFPSRQGAFRDMVPIALNAQTPVGSG